GMQTKSLRLVDAKGREWALRTVDKYAEGAVPPRLKNTIAEKIVQDMISAGYPYAAITVGALCELAGISAPKPVVYFVPDAAFLGPYREHFANTVCFLERREPEPDTKDTEDVVLEKVDHNQHQVMQYAVLNARLMDMVVADWDRHEGQWLWASKDSIGREWYYPVPLDRDQAFFMSKGLLPGLVKVLAMPHISSFKKDSRNIRMLSYKSWEFDRFFLNELDAEDWKKMIRDFTSRLNDKGIDAAVKKLPPEIYALSGAKITTILKSRRDGLMEHALNYYEFLASRVTVAGSNKDEVFRISGDKNGLVVKAFKRENGKEGSQLYERRFLSDETREIMIYGLQGDDQFIVEETANTGIRLNFYGDKGRDSYHIGNRSRIWLYDSRMEENMFVNKGNARVVYND
ncbi:MAG: BamA/TamA family outer membrane protein, partial [Flavisolibacter sp.]